MPDAVWLNGLLPGRGPGRGAPGRGPGVGAWPVLAGPGTGLAGPPLAAPPSGRSPCSGWLNGTCGTLGAGRPASVSGSRASPVAGGAAAAGRAGGSSATGCAGAAGSAVAAARPARPFAARLPPSAGACAAAAFALAAWPANASFSLRTTGASIVDEAERTNSPISVSLAITALLSTPNSFASS
jgi:hypothetical protein